MQINTPLKIALFLTLTISFCAILIFWVFNPILQIPFVIFFLITFLLIYHVLRNFFYERIKVVYKNIYKNKMVTNIKDLDIERVEKEAEQWANAKEEELNAYKEDQNYRREFIGNVSHELKTPIFNIQGYVETLLDGGINDTEINLKYLQRANKSIDRMINIIEDLDVISRLESDLDYLDFQSFNIVNLVNEVFDACEMMANEMKIKMELINESSSNFILADQDKIQQVFLNLISNSIKYGKHNGVIFVRLYDMDEKMLIEVEDDGIGIAHESINRLFERFYRVDKDRSRKVGGTGLGLAIVKHILEGHNQKINVESKLGYGTKFSFILEKP
ncbi:MAG: two-component sensor histidine kinase [Flavobacteriales bacterium]|nr:two-component sensor histidine kinase [Flavobacteriales bacterium]|tara:strand:+ start:20048 stop:21043 length:996 start_codon:yes stop_codon:yes gene_type:complete